MYTACFHLNFRDNSIYGVNTLGPLCPGNVLFLIFIISLSDLYFISMYNNPICLNGCVSFFFFFEEDDVYSTTLTALYAVRQLFEYGFELN